MGCRVQAAVASFKSPAGPRPRTRRGRCLHRPGNLAAAQAPMRRARSPALHCGREQAATDKRPLSARPAGGPMQASAPTQRGDTAFLLKTAHPKSIGPYAEGRHSMTVIRLPCLPSPGYAARLPYIAGRAFTPAGEERGGDTAGLCKRRPAKPVMPQSRTDAKRLAPAVPHIRYSLRAVSPSSACIAAPSSGRLRAKRRCSRWLQAA